MLMLSPGCSLGSLRSVTTALHHAPSLKLTWDEFGFKNPNPWGQFGASPCPAQAGDAHLMRTYSRTCEQAGNTQPRCLETVGGF